MKSSKVVPSSKSHKMTFLGIQDQEVIITKVYESQFEDCLSLDQMFFHKKTGFCRQDNYKVLSFCQIKICHVTHAGTSPTLARHPR